MSAAKKYLRSLRGEQREMKILLEMRENVFLSLLPPAIRYDKDHVQTSPMDALPERVARMCELDKEIEKRIAELDVHRAEAFKMIKQLDDNTGRTVMLLYYLQTHKDGTSLSWTDVANQLSYSEDRVRHIHGEMLEQLNKYF